MASPGAGGPGLCGGPAPRTQPHAHRPTPVLRRLRLRFLDRIMGGFRQNNISYRWLARWKKDIVTKEHIGCAKKGLTQRRGEKEAARGFLNLNLRSSNGWPVIKGIDVGAGLRAGPPVWNKRYMQYEMPTYRWHAMATPCTHNHCATFYQPLYRIFTTMAHCTHNLYTAFSQP